MKYQFFPHSIGLTEEIASVVQCFEAVSDQIASYAGKQHTSNEVISVLKKGLSKLGYSVATGKTSKDKIHVPVLFGLKNEINKTFSADAVSADGKIVIVVEAGQATENNKYTKVILQASMMFDVEYLVLAVRQIYRTHNDFDRVYNFLETMYISNRIKLPLKGILLIGY